MSARSYPWGRRRWMCDMSPSIVRVCRQTRLRRRILSGGILYACAHTCVLQNAGVRGRSFRLTGLTYVSVFECASPVLQEQAQSCFRRRIRCITIAGAVHLCLRKHTCVLQKQRVRGHASACGDVFIERAQVPVCCTMCVPLGVV